MINEDVATMRQTSKGGMTWKAIHAGPTARYPYAGRGVGSSNYAPITATPGGRAQIRSAAAAAKGSTVTASTMASSATEAASPIAKRSMMRKVGGAAWSGTKMAAKGGYKAANAVTKATLGASIGQMGAAGLLLGGAGLGLASLAFDDPAYQAGRATGAITSFHRGMKAAQQPTYGSSAFNQSTQGLVFGLHNGRTAY